MSFGLLLTVLLVQSTLGTDQSWKPMATFGKALISLPGATGTVESPAPAMGRNRQQAGHDLHHQRLLVWPGSLSEEIMQKTHGPCQEYSWAHIHHHWLATPPVQYSQPGSHQSRQCSPQPPANHEMLNSPVETCRGKRNSPSLQSLRGNVPFFINHGCVTSHYRVCDISHDQGKHRHFQQLTSTAQARLASNAVLAQLRDCDFICNEGEGPLADPGLSSQSRG